MVQEYKDQNTLIDTLLFSPPDRSNAIPVVNTPLKSTVNLLPAYFCSFGYE
jgi:hypothetical protein